ARIEARMNVDTSSVPREDNKPYSVKSGDIEDWTRAIDDSWNGKYRVVSGGRRLGLVFDAYIAPGVAPPNIHVIFAPGSGRASTGNQEMHLFKDDLDPKTVAHEFGHLMGNPDEYALTAAEYTRIAGQAGKAPAEGETVKSLMGSQWKSTKIAQRHA